MTVTRSSHVGRLYNRASGVRTRVLLYVPGLDAGGTECKVERLARALNQTLFEPIVAWSHCWGPVGVRLESAGVPVYHLPLNSTTGQHSSVLQLRDIKPDIFHSFSYQRDARDVIVAHEAEVPVIITSRENLRDWDKERRIQDWELVRNRLTHRITPVSEAVASVCVEVENISTEKVTVIHNGVAIPANGGPSPALRRELGIPAGLRLVGYVGNYRPEKGHTLLLRAFRVLLDCYPDTHLVCCGLDLKGLKARLVELAGELGIDRHVSLLDSRSDVDTIYSGLDVYVQPSDAEGFSIALLEAMSHALPIVATAVGGNPEAIVNGSSGLLVAPQDVSAVAGAISVLLEDSQRSRSLGLAAFERVKNCFPLAGMVEAHKRLYEELRPLRSG